MAKSKEERIRYANAEILGKGNLAVVEEVFAPGYVVHSDGKDYRGTRFVRKFVGLVHSAIPDLEVARVSILAQTGDTIAWQRTLRGTHRNDLRGIPPTNKKVKWSEMFVTRFEKGKIAEEWAVSDLAGKLLLNFPRA